MEAPICHSAVKRYGKENARVLCTVIHDIRKISSLIIYGLALGPLHTQILREYRIKGSALL
uniref:Uncharacterized protein n=1 Tax=Anguilla anguilla TaxID=7936 RepID=A0A0E9RED5_ANGAN